MTPHLYAPHRVLRERVGFVPRVSGWRGEAFPSTCWADAQLIFRERRLRILSVDDAKDPALTFLRRTLRLNTSQAIYDCGVRD